MEQSILIKCILDGIINSEGGYVNRAEDRGGPTNWGITLITLAEIRGGSVTIDDLKSLTEFGAREIYKYRYIEGPGYLGITSPDLLELVVDTAVNNGRSRATKWLQRSAGVIEDGILGPITVAKVNLNPKKIYRNLCAERMKAYGALVSQNHSQVVFIAGWLNRLARFVRRG